jgi:Site-specific recombinase XerD
MADRRDSKKRKLNKGEYQRSDGRYTYRYVDRNGADRWVYSWRLTATDPVPRGKTDGPCLRDLEVEILRDKMDGINQYAAEQLTLNKCFEKYISSKSGLKEQTRVRYKYNWSMYIENTIGNRTVSDIRYSDILMLLAGLIDQQGLKPNTVRGIYNLVRPVFTLAVRDNLIRKNPADGTLAEVMRSHQKKQEKRHALTEEQQDSFIAYLRDIPKYRRWYRLFIFLLGTGCRIGEARGLIWDDCDFDNGLIYIQRQVQYYRGENEEHYSEHLTTPKSSCGERVIPMFDVVRDVLIEEREYQREMGWSEKSLDGISGFIFRTKKGGCMDSQNVDGAIYRLIRNYNAYELERADAANEKPNLLPKFSAHNLRHTFCTRMCENESNIKVVQEIMGHADISTTMNIYNEAIDSTKVHSFKNLEGKIVRA